MLISRKWLQQYVDISDITINELAEKLTQAGLEVEEIKKQAIASNLIIGEVVECIPHPDSDHLHITQVDIKDKVIQIVCGASNVAKGQKVIVALPGAKLKDLEIKEGVIRGQASNGMICSLLELSVDPKTLSEESKSGIEVLDDDAIVGNQDVLAYLGIDDEILDISLTPNRNDCMSAFAMAKEVGAILNREVTLPNLSEYYEIESSLKVKVNSQKCSLYIAQGIQHIEVKESPKWIKELLQASNIKSINNVVDIANLVMLETGQPLHFYDANKVSKDYLTVCDGIAGSFLALDQETYQIEKEDIMICDANQKEIAIAGIMGSYSTMVDENTSAILIESACFSTVSIRNSARRLNITSDASIRFQKGIQPQACQDALYRAIQLLKEYANASGIEKAIYSQPLCISPLEIDVNMDRMNALLGTSFEDSQIMDVLHRLNFQPVQKGREIHIIIPMYRQDIQMEADIAEEVIRMIGFDDLKSTMPVMPSTAGSLSKRQAMRREMKQFFIHQGLQEILTYTLISKQEQEDAIMPLKEPIYLQSPMSEKRSVIRTSLLASMLESVSYNMARSIKDIAMFEVSKVYEKDLMQERVALVLSGDLQRSRWQKLNIAADFYTLKGLIEGLLQRFNFSTSFIHIVENTVDLEHFHPYQSACVYLGKELLGIFGNIHPKMQQKYGIQSVVMAELNFDLLVHQKVGKVKYIPVSKYPSVQQDFAFVVKEEVKVEKIINCIQKQGKLNKEQVIKEIEVFDIYMGEHIQKGYKSIALSVTFQSAYQTLDEKQIQSLREAILQALQKEVQANLRA